MGNLTRNLKLDGFSRTQEASSYSKMIVEKVQKAAEKVQKAAHYIPQNPQTAQRWEYLIILEMGTKLGLKKED